MGKGKYLQYCLTYINFGVLMVKFSHTTLILIAGFIWLLGGLFLMPLGLNLLVDAAQRTLLSGTAPYPLLEALTHLSIGADSAALILITLALSGILRVVMFF